MHIRSPFNTIDGDRHRPAGQRVLVLGLLAAWAAVRKSTFAAQTAAETAAAAMGTA